MNTADRQPHCPVCLAQSDCKLKVGAYQIESCTRCTHQFVNVTLTEDHVAQQFDNQYFCGGGTSGYADYLGSSKLISEQGARYAKRVNKLWESNNLSSKNMLDIGCASGFVMQGFIQQGWSAVGIDPNEMMVEHACKNGKKAFCGTLETVFDGSVQQHIRESFDLVTLIQVVAHLSNLGKAMDNLRRLVRSNGYVLVETWNSASITARTLGAYWHEYSPPNVLNFFSDRSLDRLFLDAGFSHVAGGRQFKRINLGHARSIFDYKYGGTRWGRMLLNPTKLLSDNIAIPYPSEDLFWRIYRKES